MYMNQYRINVHESIPLESGSAALKIKNYGWHIALVVKKKTNNISLYKDISVCFAQVIRYLAGTQVSWQTFPPEKNDRSVYMKKKNK